MNIRNFKQAGVRQGGFTLIELVIVIVILGILAAVAVPRFIDLSDEAEAAALDGVAGAMASAMAINYAACKAGDAGCQTVDDCTNVELTLAGGTPDGYTVTGAPIADDATEDCIVTQDSSTNTTTFQGIGT